MIYRQQQVNHHLSGRAARMSLALDTNADAKRRKCTKHANPFSSLKI